MAKGKKIAAVLGVFSIFLTILLVNIPLGATSAVSVEGYFELDVEPMITISFPSNLVMLKASLLEDHLDEIRVETGIRTNSRTGYTAYLSTNKRRDYKGDLATGLVHIVDSNKIIPTLESSTTAEDFPINHWGYSVDGGENYNGIKAYDDAGLATFVSSNSSENRDFDLYFATKIATNFPTGYYENTIIVTAVANYVPRTISDIEYMQDLDGEIALSMVEDQQYQLKDKRDEKMYFIARTKDGNVWMTQNLDYREVDENGIISFTRELSDTFTDLTFSTNGYAINAGDSVVGDSTYEGIETGGYKMDLIWFNEEILVDGVIKNQTTNQTIAKSSITEPDDERLHYDLGVKYSRGTIFWDKTFQPGYSPGSSFTFDENGKVSRDTIDGALYDKYSRDSSASVCPKGWRIPTASEYRRIPYYYGVNRENESTNLGSQALQDSPLKFIMIERKESSYARYYDYWVDGQDNNKARISMIAPVSEQASGMSVVKSVIDDSSENSAAFVRCVLRW